MEIIRKATTGKVGEDLRYVMSDGSVDAYGDTIDPNGWDLAQFDRNPVALFGHAKSFVIGRWQDVKVDGGRLIGTLILASEGTSERIDEIIRLARQGILRAVSVGFWPLEWKDRTDGIDFLKQRLVETSLVSVPANPNALQIARSMNVSDDTLSLVFGKHADADRGMRRRGLAGKHAATPPSPGIRTMEPLSKRIESAQDRIVTMKDGLRAHLDGLDDNDVTTDQMAVTRQFNEEIKQAEDQLDLLKASEASLGSRSEAATGAAGASAQPRRPFASPAKKIAPLDYFIRAAAVSILSHVTKQSPSEVLRDRYGDDEATRAVTAIMVTKAATVPANTTLAGWAAELVQTVVLDLFDALLPMSVYPGLSARGGRFTFGRNGIVSLPARSPTPSIAGSFVGQGAAIPVRQGGFTAVTLTPKKMAVISTFTREIAEHSTPSIEGILRQSIQEDTAVSLDTVLLDANAATAIRPAGLRNGVAGLTPTTGGGFNALVADLKAMVNALTVSTNGHIRQAVWIMNPAEALSISLTQNLGGDFPFATDVAAGNLLTFPLLVSAAVPAKQVILVDAADFFSATGDVPRFDVSDQATLHMEDTAPLAIGTAGTPPVVAAPTRSLWQTDTIGIRMILDVNWAMRRAGTVAWVDGVTW